MAVLAAEVQQRFARAIASLFDERDENRVIALHVPRDRAERAHRESRRTAVGVACGHDRHSGREVTENTAKLVGRDHLSYVSGSVGKNQARASPGRPALAGGRASNVLLGSTLNETAAC